MKYLAVQKYTSLSNTIDNICVVDAENSQQAQDKAAKLMQCSRYQLFVFNTEEMREEGWKYYE